MTLFGTEARLRLTDGTFSWFEGRATEERPSWGYAKAMSDRMGRATAAIDLQTGGGEVLAQVEKFPALIAATESWPPNVAIATRLLGARGVVVVIDEDEPPLPIVKGQHINGTASWDSTKKQHQGTTPRDNQGTVMGQSWDNIKGPSTTSHWQAG